MLTKRNQDLMSGNRSQNINNLETLAMNSFEESKLTPADYTISAEEAKLVKKIKAKEKNVIESLKNAMHMKNKIVFIQGPEGELRNMSIHNSDSYAMEKTSKQDIKVIRQQVQKFGAVSIFIWLTFVYRLLESQHSVKMSTLWL